MYKNFYRNGLKNIFTHEMRGILYLMNYKNYSDFDIDIIHKPVDLYTNTDKEYWEIKTINGCHQISFTKNQIKYLMEHKDVNIIIFFRNGDFYNCVKFKDLENL